LANFGYCFAEGVKEAMPKYVEALPNIMRMVGNRATTLIHGDVRLDNVMFGDGKPGLQPAVMLDWQAIMVSSPMQDIAWLLNSGVAIEMRRKHEEEFLAYYCEKIAAAGVQGYTLDTARDDYNTALLFMMCYPVIIGGAFDPANERGKALAEEGLRRSTAAVADRGLLKLIP
jgi:Ser/Thr protein kinase RdoA (MazF antagonist)